MENYLTFGNIAIAVIVPYILTYFFWRGREVVGSLEGAILLTMITNAVSSLFLFLLIVIIANVHQSPDIGATLCPTLMMIVGVPFLMARLLSY